MLRAVEAETGDASPRPRDGELVDSNATETDVPEAVAADNLMPENKSAESLFRKWLSSARINGQIPGGALRSLARATSNFIQGNPTNRRTPPLAELLKRMDTSRDWTPSEAVALLNDVTAVYDKLPSWAEDVNRFSIADVVRVGQPLPAELETAPWGKARPNGLRTAWLLDPQADAYRLHTPLKSRILYHNAGNDSVVFRALTWNQPIPHQVNDATGAEIKVTYGAWMTIAQIFVCRLAPGDFIEVVGAGIGVGPKQDDERRLKARVGASIHASPGDEVTFTPAAVSASGDDGRKREADDTNWWRDFIANRLKRDAPLPDDAAERRRILDRAVRDLFGTPPTPDEFDTFVADESPDALEALAQRLASRAGVVTFSGELLSGTTTFRVLPVDPEAAKQPRVATGPGRYQLGDQVQLVIVRKGSGVNEASLKFSAPEASAESPGKPFEIKLPNGRHTWAIAWKRDLTTLWVAEKGVVRRIDFANPADVREKRIDPDDSA
ncbi:MAG: DUF1549 domain-containing protein, partial [Planctomycetota bacterium]